MNDIEKMIVQEAIYFIALLDGPRISPESGCKTCGIEDMTAATRNLRVLIAAREIIERGTT